MKRKLSIVGLSVLLTNLFSIATIICGIFYFVNFGFSGIILLDMLTTGLLSTFSIYLFVYKDKGDENDDD